MTIRHFQIDTYKEILRSIRSRLSPSFWERKRVVSMIMGLGIGILFFTASFLVPGAWNALLISLSSSALSIALILSIIDYWNDLNAFKEIEGGLSMAVADLASVSLSLALQLAVMYGGRLSPEEKQKMLVKGDPDKTFEKFQDTIWDYLKEADLRDENLRFEMEAINNFFRVLREKKLEIDDLNTMYGFALPGHVKSPLIQIRRAVFNSLKIEGMSKDLHLTEEEYIDFCSHRIKREAETIYNHLIEAREKLEITYAA